jgi:acetylornithine deacetylase/succinyl-diaminopimelate desuccinylase-like protein
VPYRRSPVAKIVPPALAILAILLPLARLSADEALESEKRLAESVRYLASDELEGRGLTTQGINKAADYIAEQFRQVGLKTEVFDKSPFQQFEVVTSTKLGSTNTAALVGPDGKRTELKLSGDYTPLGLGGSGKLDVPLVFVGYGITAKNLEYDDFAGLDVKGKAVIILRKEPQQDNPHSKFEGNTLTQHSFFTRKASNAYQNGAAAAIFVNDEHGIRTILTRIEKQLERATDSLTALRLKIGDAKPTETQAKELKSLEDGIARDRKRLEAERDPLIPFESGGDEEGGRALPVITIRRAALDSVIKAALGKDLSAIEKEIDKDLKPQSRELTGWKLNGHVTVDRTKTPVKNVVGAMEGFGPLADETVVIGAHYDHLGFGGSGSLAPGSKEIHNGADDNASGTAALIEIARQIAERKAAARFRAFRRIVFIAFTGEERGLLGSAHYVEKPAFPNNKTVAMINLDMVGRLNEDKLVIQGVDTAKEFGALIDRLNKDAGFKITRQKGGHGPSDHTSFYTKNIPVMHFFTGTHKDYHRPSDDTEKLNIPGIRRIASLITDATMDLAGSEQKPTYVKIEASKTGGGRGGDRPYLGSIPDFSGEGSGYKLMGVAKDSPADKAGMKAGDSIIKLDTYKIGNLEDIDGALRKFKAGDKVKVTVLREGKEVVLEVTLGEPR